MATSIGLGVIGCGRVAQAHLSAIRFLGTEADLIAVYSRDAEKARRAKEEFGARYCCSTIEEVWRCPEVAAVIITLPNYLHAPIAVQAARARKHVLVEKPMALTLEQAREMVQEAKAHDTVLMIGQSRRFTTAALTLEQHLPAIGNITRVQVSFLSSFATPPSDWWRSSSESGGLITFLQGSHSVDSVLTWINKMPTQVVSFASRRNAQWEGEDEADILMAFDQGELASVHLSFNTSPPLHEAMLIGSKGRITMREFTTPVPFVYGYSLDLNGDRILTIQQDVPSFTLQLREFLEAIRDRRPPRASGEEVLRTIAVLDAAKLSQTQRSVISLASLSPYRP
jgi:predicted dehydrogenase